MKKEKSNLLRTIVILIILIIGCIILKNIGGDNISSIKSKKQLKSIYKNPGGLSEAVSEFLEFSITPMPIFSNFATNNVKNDYDDYPKSYSTSSGSSSSSSSGVEIPSAVPGASSATAGSSSSIFKGSTSKSHSTTNLQVENVDEADINKTDGNYIYSIRDDQVIITDVSNPQYMKVVNRIGNSEKYTPVDLLLDSDNKQLIIIGESSSRRSYYDTNVLVYDISNIKNLTEVKDFTIKSKYYTSRVVNGNLFVISSGDLRYDSDYDVDISYDEDSSSKEIKLDNIKYNKKEKSSYQTVIASYNLKSKGNIKVKSFLFNLSNIYVSEKNIYLINDKYGDTKSISNGLRKLFGFRSAFSFLTDYDTYDYQYLTSIYKLTIDEDNVQYAAHNSVEGKTINQFSMDEKDGNLRIALYNNKKGSRIVVLNEKLNQLGATEYIEKDEKMYSSRFIGNRAYLVTYKNMDPLFVIDLSDSKNPKVLGKLEIPGYSTYLHPYDDNHIIGIGMSTKTTTTKDSNGRVKSSSTYIDGMKMALFDVSDISKPKQISSVKIGDSKTTSAVLENHKALLFSKEKGLIAIPVNNYSSNVEITNSDDISTQISYYNSYSNYKGSKISEGYLVYNIDTSNGFKLKGTITHNLNTSYSSSSSSDLLRGLWIENTLYTVSQSEIKATNLKDMTEIGTLNLYSNKFSLATNNTNYTNYNTSNMNSNTSNATNTTGNNVYNQNDQNLVSENTTSN